MVSRPTRARYLDREYDVVNFDLDGDPYPYWVLRDGDNDVSVVDDEAAPGRRVMGQCAVCGEFTLALAQEGPSGRGPQWVCLSGECVGPAEMFP
jgi:hypothetical protein